MKHVASGLFLLSLSAAWAGPLEDFVSAARFCSGEGTALPTEYATQDMTVETKVRVTIFWTTYNSTSSVPEQVVGKIAGQLGYSLDLGTFDPNFSGLVLTLNGTTFDATTANWSFDQTFSRTGGFPVDGTFDNNGTPIVVHLTLNNIHVSGNFRSSFAYVNPFYNNTLLDNSRDRGTYANGDTSNWINIIPTSVTGTVAGLPVNGLEMRIRRIQSIIHVPYTATVSGVVSREDIVTPGPIQVAWELVGDSGTVDSGTTTAASDGTYTLGTHAPVGNYLLRVKTPTHLSKRAAVSVNVATSAPGLTLSNGDCDGDNEVGPNDFGVLSGAYGAVLGDPNFVPGADLDLDGEVGPSDFAILSSQYGQIGE